MSTETASFPLRGILSGHTGWVTSIATTSENSDMLITGSRDKSIIKWNLTRNEGDYGYAQKALKGHSHFVQDVAISSDSQFALSASWDGTLRLWDLEQGTTARRFIGHTKDVLSVAFSADNRQIVSGSRDKTIKLWNTIGECKYTMDSSNGNGNGWVSCVRFSPSAKLPVFVSGGWDNVVRVWNIGNFGLNFELQGHTANINTVTIAPDGSLSASGGRDQNTLLWDLNEGKLLYSLKTGANINCLAFCPSRYWLCAGTDEGIKVWDLESKEVIAEMTEKTENFQAKSKKVSCTSVAWSSDGTTLYAGYSDNNVRVWSATTL